ncbi:MAG TPA: UDP-N-acetylglucosamine--N-acetylmuramyl-(pentapeptide) pyrophosphoryl-undecaprenol N-acetylglucosamine transferase [bacterium]|nr:UDP-N-acetylglucosamine--N-acetylmuramyl-(pentapeptide) pyrophosphoryl-undecaprenol N-acetylglucosamine transferase [bacterium]
MNQSNKKTILLVGGGTGGHSIPLLLLYKKLTTEHSDISVKIIGSDSELDHRIFDGVEDFVPLKSGKLHRREHWRNLREAIKMISGFREARRLLRELSPIMIFSKGGFISLPVIYWAKRLHIPYSIHESDIEMGEANKYAASNAENIYVGFPVKNYPVEHKDRIKFVGQMIDDKIVSVKKYDLFGFDSQKPVIFVTGGSQGAHSLNSAVFESLSNLLLEYSIIHQVGSHDLDEAKMAADNLPAELRKNYFVRDFLEKENGNNMMGNAYSLADLVVSRAGATTLAEIALYKKPSILIPYQFASDNHQQKNAEVLVEEGAAVMIKNDNLNKTELTKTILNLMSDQSKRTKISDAVSNIFPRNAVSIISKEIMEGR